MWADIHTFEMKFESFQKLILVYEVLSEIY